MTEQSIDAFLGGLKELNPQLALVVVIVLGGLITIYLLTRPAKSQNQTQEAILKITSSTVTDLSESHSSVILLTQQVGQLRLEMNIMQTRMAELERENKELKEANVKAVDQGKLVQEALDMANKKLDALHIILAAKEARESELVLENIALRKEIQELRAQIADLQFQLNQFLKLTSSEDAHEDFTASPDL